MHVCVIVYGCVDVGMCVPGSESAAVSDDVMIS